MKEYKVDHYTIGIEILDKETKKPIEHREYETEVRLDEAMKRFDEFKLQNDEQKYINAMLTNGNFVNLRSAKRITTARVLAEPLNLENADGFVIDLSTAELVFNKLKEIIPNNIERVNIEAHTVCLDQLRMYILDYYTIRYRYILMRPNNVYQIIEEELYTKSKQ